MHTRSVNVPDTFSEFKEMFRRGRFGLEEMACFGERDTKEWLLKLIKESSVRSMIDYYKSSHVFSKVFKLSGAVYNNADEDKYTYIPLEPILFLEDVKDAITLIRKQKTPIKFIDAGCGVGDKVYLVDVIFDVEAYGVEYDRGLVEMAYAKHDRHWNDYKRDKNIKDCIVQGDIRKFDFSPYTLIYAYNPMRTEEGMQAFFRNVRDTAKDGTICLFENVESGYRAIRKLTKSFIPLDKNEYPNKIFMVRK